MARVRVIVARRIQAGRAKVRRTLERARQLVLFVARSNDVRARRARRGLAITGGCLLVGGAWWLDARPTVRIVNATNHPLVVVVDGEVAGPSGPSAPLDERGGERAVRGGVRLTIPPTSTETPEGGVTIRLAPGAHVFRVASLTRETPLDPAAAVVVAPPAAAPASASASPDGTSEGAAPVVAAANTGAPETTDQPSARATLKVAPDRAALLSTYGSYLFVAATDEQCFFVQRTAYGIAKPAGPPEVALDRASFFWPIPRSIDAVFSPNPPPVAGDKWSTGGERVALRQRRCDLPLHDVDAGPSTPTNKRESHGAHGDTAP